DLGLEVAVSNYSGAVANPNVAYFNRLKEIHPIAIGARELDAKGGEVAYYHALGRQDLDWIAAHPWDFLNLCGQEVHRILPAAALALVSLLGPLRPSDWPAPVRHLGHGLGRIGHAIDDRASAAPLRLHSGRRPWLLVALYRGATDPALPLYDFVHSDFLRAGRRVSAHRPYPSECSGQGGRK